MNDPVTPLPEVVQASAIEPIAPPPPVARPEAPQREEPPKPESPLRSQRYRRHRTAGAMLPAAESTTPDPIEPPQEQPADLQHAV